MTLRHSLIMVAWVVVEVESPMAIEALLMVNDTDIAGRCVFEDESSCVVPLIRISLACVNSPRRESGSEHVV